MSSKFQINIQTSKPNNSIDLQTISTNDGFLLVYLENGDIRVKGDIELRAIAPFLMKYLAQKMAGAGMYQP